MKDIYVSAVVVVFMFCVLIGSGVSLVYMNAEQIYRDTERTVDMVRDLDFPDYKYETPDFETPEYEVPDVKEMVYLYFDNVGDQINENLTDFGDLVRENVSSSIDSITESLDNSLNDTYRELDNYVSDVVDCIVDFFDYFDYDDGVGIPE